MTTSNICPYCKKKIQDYQEIGNFRIYKWDKPVKDFPMPKGFRLAEEREFIDLYDNDKIELENYPVMYFTKNRSKKNIKEGYQLSGLCLVRNLGTVSSYDDLANSYDNGRVVVVRK
jgi:hypothetical protein